MNQDLTKNATLVLLRNNVTSDTPVLPWPFYSVRIYRCMMVIHSAPHLEIKRANKVSHTSNRDEAFLTAK